MTPVKPGDSCLNRDDKQPILPGTLPGQPGHSAWGAEEKLHQDAGTVQGTLVYSTKRVHYSKEQSNTIQKSISI